MGLFDDQIKQRQLNDEKVFEKSLQNIAGSISGGNAGDTYRDETLAALNAISHILRYYHLEMPDIPENISDPGEQLRFALRPHGIMKRRVRLSEGWRKNAFEPMLFMGGIPDNSGNTNNSDTISPYSASKAVKPMIALIPDALGGYICYDGTTGERLRITSANESLFHGEAYCFYTTFPQKSLEVKDLILYLISLLNLKDCLMVAAAGIGVVLAGLMVPYINRILFSRVAASYNIGFLLPIASFLLCASTAGLLFRSIQSMLHSRVTEKLEAGVESAATIRLLSLPIGFFRRFSSGELSARIGYLNLICSIITSGLFKGGLTFILSLLYALQIAYFTPALVAPALIVTLINTCISGISIVMESRLAKCRMAGEAKAGGLSYAFISGIQKIKLSGSEKRAFARWGDEYAKQVEAGYGRAPFVYLAPVITTAVSLLGTLVIYRIALECGIGTADYYAFNSAFSSINIAFATLLSTAGSMAQLKPVMDMVEPILKETPEYSDNKAFVEHISGALEINNLHFRYNENMPYVLKGLSLKINPGQYVAIVGRTGCGKTTLTRLLLGFEQPRLGAIYYDGRDVAGLDLKSLRSHIGVVSQNSTLFEGDIFSNITISSPRLSMDEAWEAARLAGIEEDIRNMPMGMYTHISEGGGGISGGQKQRLMIARAIAGKPKLLIFDEATSALDNITQKLVSESLSSLNCTRIVIAHRLSTIKDCDRILVLDEGQIIEDGTYESLMAAGGFFAELVKRQQVE